MFICFSKKKFIEKKLKKFLLFIIKKIKSLLFISKKNPYYLLSSSKIYFERLEYFFITFI